VTSRPTDVPSGTPRPEVASELAATFRRHHVPAILVRAPGVDAGAAGAAVEGDRRHDLDVVVPWGSRRLAERAMDELGWRVAIGGLGAWSVVPTISYHWDNGPSLDLHRGIPVGPLPPGSLRRVERMLRSRSRPTACGIPAPDAPALAVFAAVQAARPGPFRKIWLGDVAEHLRGADPGEARRIAEQLGVGPALRWASSPIAPELGLGREGPLFGAEGWARLWSLAARLRRRIRPRRAGVLIGGVPRPVAAIARTRFAGLEFRSGPGAFVPQPVTEPMVGVALAGLPPDGGVMVDVGTGVGAVAFAVARTRPDVRVIGCDVSRAGLRWAERNRRRLGLENVRFLRGSLLDPLGEDLAGRVDVIAANVPYVPAHVFGEGYEDREGAVVGSGSDGLDLLRQVVASSTGFLVPKGRLVLQTTIDQWELLAPEMAGWGFALQPIASSSFEDAICWGIADGRPS
jgi:release factor glutamine methyltransferase